ncbi:MAG: nuclear transport factor 2 family protein [Polyangiaceae bacterium]
MRDRLSVFLLSALSGCGGAGNMAPPAGAPSRAIEKALSETLDDFHLAAARADEERYFAHFAAEGVFLGTDAKERWTVPSFRAYAHPHFVKGKAWSFRATERHWVVSARGDMAWFDELLETKNLGQARGSGVLVFRGEWLIAQYNLALVVPNERFKEVKALLENPLKE